MIRLYESGGSREINLIGRRMLPEVWSRARETAARLLKARGDSRAAELVLSIPFELWDATNSFGDEFAVLYSELPLDEYLRVADVEHDPASQEQFRLIANALAETDVHVRFIAASLDDNAEPATVPAPSPRVTSEALERSLVDVERALSDGRPSSGIDRIRTALHAYLKGLARGAGLEPQEAGIPELFKMLRQSHPALQATGPRAADLTRVLNAMATIVDALNPLRNKASLAHPTEELLADAEAMLVINAARTLFHYLEKKMRLASP